MSEGVKTGPKAVANVQRRQWDKEEFDRIAKEKIAAADEDAKRLEQAERIRQKPVERNPLSREQSRKVAGDAANDIMSKVGKVKLTTAKAFADDRIGAFHCKLTGKTFSDSITYLDHINGKKYQKELGMNMRVKRSTHTDIKRKLAEHRDRVEEEKNYSKEDHFVDLDTRMARQAEEYENIKRQKREYKAEKKKREEEELKKEMEAGIDPEMKAMAEMMGLPMGFGSSKTG